MWLIPLVDKCVEIFKNVKMSGPSLTHALSERLEDEQLIIKCYRNKAYFTSFRFNIEEVGLVLYR